ncbi:MAG: aldose epimerase family protein [Christensenellales bacterium]
MGILVKPFGMTPDGEKADLITLSNRSGASVSLLSLGAHLVSVRVPDKAGRLKDVTLGMDSLAEYLETTKGYMGATVGRYANRIGGAAFTLNGKTYSLFANNGANTLHGGKIGFDKKLWRYETFSQGGRDSVRLSYTSPDMEEGFPGNMEVSVTFSWDDACQLRLDYGAASDQDTLVNLTNHAYFNLGDAPDIKGHTLQIAGDRIIAVGSNLIPTGEMKPVDGTPYDLRQAVLLGEALARTDDAMFVAVRGFDVGYVLPGSGLREVARLHDPASGRLMKVLTDQPGVQCYSGQGFNCTGRGGVHYGPYAGLALETQQHPDSIHHPHFGDTTLRAGASYATSTIYAFEVQG